MRKDAFGDRFFFEFFGRDAGPVVFDLDPHFSCLIEGTQIHRALFRLARLLALGG